MHEDGSPSWVRTAGKDDFAYVSANPGWVGIGSRVILSKNEWKEAGLCNGIQGKVVRIVYHPVEGNKPGALPVLLVQWGEGYIGPSFLPWLDRVTPVTKIRDPHKKNKGVTRTGLPIALAFGISVGKTQGMTSVEGLTVSFGRSAGRYKGCSE
jgi:hypothetical protein